MIIQEKFQLHAALSPSDHPEISVILSTYNRCRPEHDCPSLLHRAIDSILNQTFRQFELILIDDASSDTTAEYCKQLATSDPRIRFYQFYKNSGIPAQRYNFGMSQARAKYISFMFDDDQLELNALQDLYTELERLPSSYGMVYGLTTLYIGNERDKVRTLGGKWRWNKIDSTNFIANNSVLVKKSAIDQVGGYDEDPVFMRICDWDLWWRLRRKFRVGRITKNVSIVYAGLHDSIGITQNLQWKACRKRQRAKRTIPLQKQGPEPIRCKIQSMAFDIYVFICQRERLLNIARQLLHILRKIRKYLLPVSLKKIAKAILSDRAYQILKKTSGPSRKFLPLGPRQSPGIEIVEDGGCIDAILPPSSTTQSRELSRRSQCQEFTGRTTSIQQQKRF